MAAVRTTSPPAREVGPAKRTGRRRPADRPSGEQGPRPSSIGATESPEPAPRRGLLRRIVRRIRWRSVALTFLALVLLVVPAVLAGYRSAQQPPTYAAQADVVYTATEVNDTEAVERELATQQQLLVNRGALEAAGAPVNRSATELADDVSTEVLEGSDLIRVRVEDRNEEVARRLTESLVTQYTERVRARSVARMDEQRAAVDGRIAALDQRLIAIADRIRVISVGGVFAPAPLQAEQRSLETEAQVLREQISGLQMDSFRWSVDNPAAGLPTAEVLSPATPLDEPVGPQPLRAAAAGGVLGLLLAFLLLAFTRPRRPSEPSEAATARP